MKNVSPQATSGAPFSLDATTTFTPGNSREMKLVIELSSNPRSSVPQPPICPIYAKRAESQVRWRVGRLAVRMAVSTEERRIVTVLFADMAGSTALGEQLDPEEMRGLLARYYAIARQTVQEHGGTVEKFIGDAVMAVFGLPTAHGDDPDRAVAAACARRAASRRPSPRRSSPGPVRCGRPATSTSATRSRSRPAASRPPSPHTS